MPDALGLAALAGSVLLFALFSLPTKTSQLGDGLAFQLLMALGIWGVGCVVFAAQCAARPGGACPPLSPQAALGGAIWATSNVLLTPIVKCIGVGPAMMAWGLNECLIGWATGRFGLFGVRPEPVRDAAANVAGVALAVVSLAVLAAVQPAVADGSDKAALVANDDAAASISTSSTSSERLLLPLDGGGNGDAQLKAALLPAVAEAAEAAFEERGYDFTASLSPAQKRAFGLAACVVAGALSGSTFTPPQVVVDGQASGGGGSARIVLFDLLFSHFCGILFASFVIFLLYCAATRGRPWVRGAMVLPSLYGGLCWGAACACWFVTNERLSLVVAMPVVTIGPGVLTMLIGAVAFKEVQGARNVALMAASVVIYTAGAVLIATSGE
jgi:hypothetical protein